MANQSITTEEALEILENSEVSAYTPKGHTFTIYSLDELMTTYIAVFGGAIVAFGIIWLLMRVLGGDRY